jgi:hypothetical protein
MLMVHNGHLADDVFNGVASLATPGVPLLSLAPHVAASIANRTQSPGWLLPTLPFVPPSPCALADVKAGRQCVRGFSVQGRIEKSRRNYTQVPAGGLCSRAFAPPSCAGAALSEWAGAVWETAHERAHRPANPARNPQVWEQIGGHKRHQRTSATTSNFKLNILGELVEAFAVPGARGFRVATAAVAAVDVAVSAVALDGRRPFLFGRGCAAEEPALGCRGRHTTRFDWGALCGPAKPWTPIQTPQLRSRTWFRSTRTPPTLSSTTSWRTRSRWWVPRAQPRAWPGLLGSTT